MTKQCNQCNKIKNEEEFYFVNKRNKKTIFHICKACCSIKKSKLKEYYRDWELKSKYGISLDEYKKATQLRDNCCDICDKQVKTLHVDHNHITKQVRGFLCGSCNRALGLLQDSSKVAHNAYLYLQSWEKYEALRNS